jgi:hypothetical protein
VDIKIFFEEGLSFKRWSLGDFIKMKKMHLSFTSPILKENINENRIMK